MAIVKDDNKIILSGNLIINKNKEILLLYRPDNDWFETPGGKVETKDCKNEVPTIEDLKRTAIRELKEELGNNFEFKELEYFTSVEFNHPKKDIQIIAHKFVTEILSGTPKINEKTFTKLEYIKISELKNYKLSPDLKLLLPKLL